MDRRILRSASCNSSGNKNPPPASLAVVPRSSSAVGVGYNKDDDAAGERKAMLPRLPPGGMARKGRKRSNQRVQWKDRHGKKLSEVLEFQPSDSSDSDDEYLDTCICSVM